MKELIDVVRYESRESLCKYYDYRYTSRQNPISMYNNGIGMLTENVRIIIQQDVNILLSEYENL